MDIKKFDKDDFDTNCFVTPKFSLVFHGNSHSVRHVTHHAIDGHGKIQAGETVAPESVKKMVSDALKDEIQVRRRDSIKLIQAHLLLDRFNRTIWYRKAQKRKLLFLLGKRRYTISCQLPALLFTRFDRSLSIFALNSDERPTEQSRLYNAPLMNVGGCGSLCLGMARLPRKISSDEDTLKQSEACFFDYYSTHVNHSQVLKSTKAVTTNNLFDYYKKKENHSDKPFNVDDLQPTHKKLGEII